MENRIVLIKLPPKNIWINFVQSKMTDRFVFFFYLLINCAFATFQPSKTRRFIPRSLRQLNSMLKIKTHSSSSGGGDRNSNRASTLRIAFFHRQWKVSFNGSEEWRKERLSTHNHDGSRRKWSAFSKTNIETRSEKHIGRAITNQSKHGASTQRRWWLLKMQTHKFAHNHSESV